MWEYFCFFGELLLILWRIYVRGSPLEVGMRTGCIEILCKRRLSNATFFAIQNFATSCIRLKDIATIDVPWI